MHMDYLHKQLMAEPKAQGSSYDLHNLWLHVSVIYEVQNCLKMHQLLFYVILMVVVTESPK